jgi:hypothetical protein
MDQLIIGVRLSGFCYPPVRSGATDGDGHGLGHGVIVEEMEGILEKREEKNERKR